MAPMREITMNKLVNANISTNIASHICMGFALYTLQEF
jgi:hypothetical protein